MCIIDIMDENGILLKWEKAKQQYDLNISSCLSWLGIIKSIPTAWKFNLRDSLFGNLLTTDLQNESMACISSKMAYQKLIQPLSKPPTSQLYFEKLLGFGRVEWEKFTCCHGQLHKCPLYVHFTIKFSITFCILMNDYLKLTLLTVHYAHSVELTSQSNTYFTHAQ